MRERKFGTERVVPTIERIALFRDLRFGKRIDLLTLNNTIRMYKVSRRRDVALHARYRGGGVASHTYAAMATTPLKNDSILEEMSQGLRFRVLPLSILGIK